MTLPQSLLVLLTILLFTALAFSLAEGPLELRGASAWIAIAGVLTLLGGLLAVIGAIKNNAEQTELILGNKNTFCQLTVYHDSGAGWSLSTYHAGPGGAIYDVQVLIKEVHEDGATKYDPKRVVIGTLTSTTWPWSLVMLGFSAPLPPNKIIDKTPRYFESQVTQRNGVSIQDIVLYPRPDGGVEIGFLRLTFNGVRREPDFKLLPAYAKGIQIPQAEVARIAALRGWQ